MVPGLRETAFPDAAALNFGYSERNSSPESRIHILQAANSQKNERMRKMKVTYSDILMDTITVFRVDGNIPSGANAVRIDGTVHDLVPAYGGQDITLAIQGAYDLSGKELDFQETENSSEA